MTELYFIGIGSAFNTKLGNTSAFMREGQSMLLIDCGGIVFHSLLELKLLEGIKELNIVISHTHPDHVGSLGEVIFYAHYALKIVPKLYFPEEGWIKTFLKHIGVEEKMYELVSSMETTISSEAMSNVKLSFIPVSHLPTLPSFGFIFEKEGKAYYYSGDANALPERVIKGLTEGKIEGIYQDTCGLDYDGNAHLSLRKLCEIIPESLRKKVCCIHHDSFLKIDEVRRLGFSLPRVYEKASMG